MLSPTFREERKFWQNGYKYVAGVDEVGRGAWAGPIVAAAVIFGDDRMPRRKMALVRIRDSKLLTPSAREELFTIITQSAIAWSTGLVAADVIDRIGIVEANRRAMRMAIKRLRNSPDVVLTDAFPLSLSIPCYAMRDGDGRVRSISAASILTKVWRDRLMQKLHFRYPQYCFNQHKGYGTALHEQAIRHYGMSPIHRCSFVPSRCILRV